MSAEIAELERKLTEDDIAHPEPCACGHCDFSRGTRGMDRCGKCDGYGSVFRVGALVFMNTEEGYRDACKVLTARALEDR